MKRRRKREGRGRRRKERRKKCLHEKKKKKVFKAPLDKNWRKAKFVICDGFLQTPPPPQDLIFAFMERRNEGERERDNEVG